MDENEELDDETIDNDDELNEEDNEQEEVEEPVKTIKGKSTSSSYKGTDKFKATIQEYLDHRAEEDELFAITLKKENKNINDCINYILNTVKNSGCNGFEDNEIFGMAVHYYDEDNIEPGKSLNATVVVNHKIELTAEDLVKAKDEAMKKAIDEQYKKITKKKSNKPSQNKPDDPKLQQIISGDLSETKKMTITQQSLF